jgi:hypothetical protein
LSRRLVYAEALMKPYLVGETVHIPVAEIEKRILLSQATLCAEHLSEARIRAAIERKVWASNPFASPEFIASVDGKAIIDSVDVVIQGGSKYFFYKLFGSDLLWPHGALEVRARSLTVNVRKDVGNRPWHDRKGMGARILTNPDLEGSVLFVGGMPWEMNDVGLLRLFTPFGDVEGVDIHRDTFSGRSRGFAGVNLPDVKAAHEAIFSLNGAMVTSDGNIRPGYSEEYESWLNESWNVDAERSTEYDDNVQVAARLIAIVTDASRRLAEHIAQFPAALMQIEWRDFERMLAVVFEGLGFIVTCGRGSKDGGIDLTIRTKSSIYVVQVKHWISGKKVGGSILKTTLSVALDNRFDGGVVLSTSGFSRNAATAVTTVERKRLRIGGRWEIHSLCETFVGASQGLLLPLDPDAIVRSHTKEI